MMRVFQTHGVASFDQCSVVHSFVPSEGSSAVRTPAAFPTVSIFLVLRHVYGCVPATIVVGPVNVSGGSDVRRVQSNIDRSVLVVDDTATIPTLPAASTPTVANAGLKPAPEIFAV